MTLQLIKTPQSIVPVANVPLNFGMFAHTHTSTHKYPETYWTHILAGTGRRRTTGPAAVNKKHTPKSVTRIMNINSLTQQNGNCVWTAPKVVRVTVEGVSSFLPRSRIAIQ